MSKNNCVEQQEGGTMKWRSPRVLILILVAFLIAIIGLGAVIIYLRTTAADITVVWQTSLPSFSQQDRQSIQKAWEVDVMASSAHASTIAGHTFTSKPQRPTYCVGAIILSCSFTRDEVGCVDTFLSWVLSGA